MRNIPMTIRSYKIICNSNQLGSYTVFTVSLEDLYKQLSNLSNSICARCLPPYHCCIPHGCKQAEFWANHVYKIELPRRHAATMDAAKTNGSTPSIGVEPFIDPTIPFLTNKGCILEPHHRPLCTNWLCEDALKVAPPEFFELRKQIVRADAERWREISAHSGG